MKRVLCIVSNMDAGGAETFLMKLYRALDTSRYQMDFCVSGNEAGFYDEEIIARGGRIYRIHRKTESFRLFARDLRRVIRAGEYRHVLRIAADCFGALDLWIAAFSGAKVRALRSSNAGTTHRKAIERLHKLLRVPLTTIANVKIAPSDLAASFTFGNRAVRKGRVTFLRNAIDLGTYRFDSAARTAIRTELGLENALVVGHIGRFNEQKNHAFLLRVFAEIYSRCPAARLVLVGKGELEQAIGEQAAALGIQNAVVLTGVRTDVPALLSAFDVFLFPSLFEGMPNTVIEAQANGLPCVIADTITREADVTGNVQFLSLEEPPAYWAERVLAAERISNDQAEVFLKDKGYDIQDTVNQFTEMIFCNKTIST